MRSLAVVVAFGLFACSGDTPTMPDGGFKCTGAYYDKCNTEHDCMSQNCQLFMTAGFQVCSNLPAMPCSATSPCPNDSTGQPATCNPMGLCQPAAANVCHL